MRKHSSLALLFLVFLLGLSSTCFAASEAEAASAIAATRERVVLCYGVVSGADEAGANVSSLLSVLDEAGWLLSKAELAYGKGDYDSALGNATSGLGKLDGFETDARRLRDSALWQRNWDFWVNFVGSGVGAVAVLVGGFLAWRFIKKKYAKSGAVAA